MAAAIKHQKRWMTPKQLSEEGVVPWSKRTIERYIRFEGLPHAVTPNGAVIDLDDLEKWMNQRKQTKFG